MADTFTCDNCGREFSSDQMKEVKKGDSDNLLKVDPGCLDKLMNEGGHVYGVEGEEKRRAAYIADGPQDAPDEPATGRRGE
ncbi:MAG: hypothetical protein M3198_09460 [Actinomycetota bacterium]|nr:hypothetical protein [Actinomycetota bacterium]